VEYWERTARRVKRAVRFPGRAGQARRIEHAAPGRARGLPPAGRQHAGGGTTGRGHADPTPLGVEANRRNLEVAIDYAYRQRLIPRRFTVDELFDDATRGLDAT